MKPHAAAVGLLALVAGCAVGPVYRPPALLTGAAPVPALGEAADPAYDTLAPLPPRWWKLFDDPVLDALVEKALVRNTDLRIALATLEQVQASLQAAEGKLLPETKFSANASQGRISIDAVQSISVPTLKSYSATEVVTYDVDLFGKLRAAVAESSADVEAVQAALDLVRVNVAAQVAKAYAEACSAAEQIDLGEQSVRLAQTVLDVTQRQFDAGTKDGNAVVRAETQLHQAASKLPSYVTQQRTAWFNLATLVGDPPQAVPDGVAACTRPPVLRRPIPVGDGTRLLARRPDIRAAERRLAASVADIDASTAELYPSFSIGALGGRTKSSLDGQSSTRINLFSFGGLVNWSFPNVSAARAQIAASTAAAKSALATFDGRVLTALKEAETQLVTLARQLDAEQELVAARDGAAAYSSGVSIKYSVGGVGKVMDVLSAYQSLLDAETALANARDQVSQDQIALFKALGGGWQEAPPVAETRLEPVVAASGPRGRWSRQTMTTTEGRP